MQAPEVTGTLSFGEAMLAVLRLLRQPASGVALQLAAKLIGPQQSMNGQTVPYEFSCV